MCLSIPAKVIEVSGNQATVSVSGATYEACLDLVENVVVGDYVLLHTGFALQKLDPIEALETIEMLKKIENL